MNVYTSIADAQATMTHGLWTIALPIQLAGHLTPNVFAAQRQVIRAPEEVVCFS